LYCYTDITILGGKRVDDLSLILAIIGLVGFFVFFIMGILSVIKKSGKAKTNFKFAGFSILSMILFFVIFGITSDNSESTSSETKQKEKSEEVANETNAEVNNETSQAETTEAEVAEEEVVLSPREEMFQKIGALIESKQAFDTGSYIKGEIPKGEYAFISFEGSGQYFGEEDPSGNIIDNENFDSFGYVYVHDAGNIETQGALISVNAFKTLGVSGAKQIYEIMNEVEDYKDSGWYKVGTDIPAGKYVVESYGEGYVAAMAGPVGKSEIVDNENFNGKHMVNVTAGQYLNISNGFISQ
jgi:membrane protein implicated in regulation of membrane protease activity